MGVQSGSGLILQGLPRISMGTSNKINLGKHVALISLRDANPLQILSQCHLCCLTEGAEIIIGDDVAMSGAIIISASRISIGARTMIGANCTLIDTDFHPLLPQDRIGWATQGAKTKPVTIGEDCFIGMKSIILKGSVLGNGCVVGAGSLVSGVFPEMSVLGGNPAKVIRTL
jgi:acetyltransferase-like isoleucine patch superfamily enzyme